MNQSTVHALTAIAGLLIGFAFLFTAIKPVHAQEYTFGPPINLSNNTGGVLPHLTAAGNNVYVLWPAGFASSVLRTSANNGATFGDLIKLPIAGQDIAASSSNVYVVGLRGGISFIASNDNGNSFSPPVELGGGGLPEIAAQGKDVYIVWQFSHQDIGSQDWESDVLFRASNDNGLIFNEPINLSNNTGKSTEPKIDISGNNVYVIWQEDTDLDGNTDEIFFKASNDNGLSFTDAINLSKDSGRSLDPLISASGSNVYVVWQEISLKRDVLFRASHDGGATFGDVINLTENLESASDPQIAASGGNVYLAWNTHDILFFRASYDNGRTFGETVKLNDRIGPQDLQWQPKIAVSKNNVHVLWTDQRDIFFSASDDNGLTFGDIFVLSDEDMKSSGAKGGIDLAASGTHVYAVWHDFATDQWEVLFRAASMDSIDSSNNGMTIKLNKSFYWADECIHVSGTVGAILEGGPIKIRVLDPENVVRFQAYTLPNQDGTYSLDFILRESGGFGTYIVTATYGLTTVKTSFFVPEVMFGTDPFEPEYFLTNGCVLSYQVKPNSTSLIVSVSTNATDGELNITMPRALIDARTNGNDDDFVVLIDGEKIDFQETNVTMISRTLAIPVQAGAKEIEIIGTHVIPEFPVNLMGVIAVGLIGALITLRVKGSMSFQKGFKQ